MTTPRRPFNRAAFLAGYRAACADRNIDPLTGNPTACDDPMWWAVPDYWAESGPNHSSVEAAAISSIARQARAIAGVPEPQTVDQAVREAWEADGADRMVQIPLPLRDIHKARGVEVVTLNGLRIEVPIKVA